MVIVQENRTTNAPQNTLSMEAQSQIVPTLSIIIPTYNNAKYISQALKSVFAQNYPSLEIIIIDDGSTDDTQSVLSPYAGQVRYLYQENAGSAVARNTGLRFARGKYVVFLDADDLLLPGKFDAQVALLEKRPSLGMVHSGWQIIDELGHVLRTVEPWHDIPELDLDAWVWHKPVFMGAMMFRRSLLEQVNGFDSELRQSQDVDLLLRLALAGLAAAWLRRPTYQYRIHTQSTIRQNATAQHHFLMRVLDKFFADSRVPSHLMRDERAIRYYSLRWIAWHFVETGNLADISQPLQDAWDHSANPPCETVLDWIAFFARSYETVKRTLQPSSVLALSTLPELWPHLASVVELDEPWTVIERFLNWGLPHQSLNVLDESKTKQFLVEMWGVWQTAVSAETTLAIPAELIIDWYLWFSQGVKIWEIETTIQFLSLTPPQMLSLTQWCIVQEPESVTGPKLESFWFLLAQMKMIEPKELHLVVSLLLTLFGQHALRRQWADARAAFLLAWRCSAFSRKSIAHWVRFAKTAVSYPFQSKHKTITNDSNILAANNRETRS